MIKHLQRNILEAQKKYVYLSTGTYYTQPFGLPMDPIESQFVTIMDSDTDQNLTFDLNWSLMVVPFF